MLVDISHSVAQHDEAEAAFTLHHAYAHFPKGSIHIVGVSCELNSNVPLLLMEADGHYFICAANSCLSLMFLKPSCVVSVPSEKKTARFALLDIAPRVVHQLLSGVQVKDLGAPTKLPTAISIEPVLNFKLSAAGKQIVAAIVGRILHIDNYGNAITNISQTLYNEQVCERSCTVLINSNYYKVPKIFSTYTDVDTGDPVAFFNSLGLLEVATNHGNACHLYRLDKKNSTITIMFDNS
jgi:S-adenosylmethionine hydrolase